MNVVLSSFIGALFYYGSDIFAGKTASSQIGVVNSNLLRFVYLGAIALVYLVFVSQVPIFPTDLSSSGGKDYFYILLTALGMGIGNTILVWTLQRYKAATALSYFESFAVLIGVLVGYFVFREAISPRNLMALALVMIGIYLYQD